MINIIIEDEEKIKNAKYFLTGFQGLGSVGYIAIKHIIDVKKANRVGVIKSKASPPFIYLENNSIVMPFELYEYDNILIFLPRLPPYRHNESEFSESLVKWILDETKVELVILIGGVDKNLQTPEDSEVEYVPTRNFLSDITDLVDLKENMLSSGLMIQGPLAVMLGNLDLEQFPGIGILSFAERDKPDTKGAASAINIVNKMLEINISTEELLSNEESFDEEMRKLPASNEDYKGGPPEAYT